MIVMMEIMKIKNRMMTEMMTMITMMMSDLITVITVFSLYVIVCPCLIVLWQQVTLFELFDDNVITKIIMMILMIIIILSNHNHDIIKS